MKESYLERVLLNKIKKLEKRISRLEAQPTFGKWPYDEEGNLMVNVDMSDITFAKKMMEEQQCSE